MFSPLNSLFFLEIDNEDEGTIIMQIWHTKLTDFFTSRISKTLNKHKRNMISIRLSHRLYKDFDENYTDRVS